MGGVASFKPFTIIITATILIAPSIVAEADDDTRETPPPIPKLDDDNNGGIATTSPTVSATYSGHRHAKKSEPLKPSTVIMVCVLTTVFSITFILLLYIKHCISGSTFTLSNRNSLGTQSSSEERKNSGVDRAVVESLPIFRFGSLRGQKEGLECAVCLARFEDSEVLRLLPKCNHAFHVECVDTWLNAHSTCPLCRYKVNLEDVIIQRNSHKEPSDITDNATQPKPRNLNRRVSGRHSWVGEREGEFLQNAEITTTSFRRSFDSASRNMKGKSRSRKDGMLMLMKQDKEGDLMMTSEEHRLEHRIIVSPTKSQCGGVHQKRWSNVEPSDLLLYLTSEMIISEPSSPSSSRQQNMRLPLLWNTRGGRRSVRNSRNVDDEMEKGGMVNLRSVSETTGLSRFLRNGNRNRGGEGEEQRHEGAVSRWFAWISNTNKATFKMSLSS